MFHRWPRRLLLCRLARALLIVCINLNTGLVRAVNADLEKGQNLAHDVYRGNCLACHQIPADLSAVSLANIGPPLAAMRQRFPDRAQLRNQIWDPTLRNPQTVMPPFGKHGILTEQEIDLIVEYLYRY
jgi:L-cysteine S-thiosulfotransferase